MTSLDKLPVTVAADPPGHDEAARSLREGNPFTCILSDDPAQRAALVQAVMNTAADMDTRFVQVGNPLRSPLTIERVFMQAVGPEAEIRHERDGGALTRILAHRVSDETRLVVVIEQAETLDPEAVKILQSMAPSFKAVEPRIQFLFSGTPAFARMLAAPAPTPDVPAAPAPVPPQLAAVSAPVARPAKSRIPRIFAVALGALAGAAILAWQREPDLLRGLGVPLPQAPKVAPAAEAAPPTVAPQAQAQAAAPPATPPATPIVRPVVNDTAALRREFDRFLAERPDLARLSEATKDELFQEFLQRRGPRSGTN